MIDRLGSKLFAFLFVTTDVTILALHDKLTTEVAAVITTLTGIFFGIQALREKNKESQRG